MRRVLQYGQVLSPGGVQALDVPPRDGQLYRLVVHSVEEVDGHLHPRRRSEEVYAGDIAQQGLLGDLQPREETEEVA